LKALGYFQEAGDGKNSARCQANLANIDIATGDFRASLAAFKARKYLGADQ